MGSKNRKKYKSPQDAFLGGLKDKLDIPDKVPFAKLSPEKQKEVLDWLDMAEKDGPAFEEYVKKNQVD